MGEEIGRGREIEGLTEGGMDGRRKGGMDGRDRPREGLTEEEREGWTGGRDGQEGVNSNEWEEGMKKGRGDRKRKGKRKDGWMDGRT